jgi:hypothetical protein
MSIVRFCARQIKAAGIGTLGPPAVYDERRAAT